MPTLGLYTLGCKVAQYETQAIAERAEARGFTLSSFSAVCDAYVINTCTVTAESDRKSRQFIRRAIKKNPNAVIAVVGCYSQTSAEEVAAIEGVDIVLGTQDKLSVPDRILARLQGKERAATEVSVPSLDGAPFEPMCITRAPRTRAYVKIEDGCECRCTYCEIPKARGEVRSKPADEVIAEVLALSRSGTQEVVLTGIETASYGIDLTPRVRLIDLLERLDAEPDCPRIRLGSLSPEIMTEDFARRIGALSCVVPHFHLSMQSGSDAVLRRMKRRYSRDMALAAMRRARQAMPRVQFTTDLIVGFPAESEADFADTVALVREGQFLDAHVFAYSPRPGTEAAAFADQIPDAVKHDRSARLIAEAQRVRDGILDRLVADGEVLSVIPEVRKGNEYSAHADTFVEVRVRVSEDTPGLHGSIVSVRPTGHKDGVLYTELA